jgi:glycosyltransferase involved in cell wall biosynthesis
MGHDAPRVLFVLNHAGAGGTERYVESLMGGLVPQGMSAMLAYHEEGPLVARLADMGIPCVRVRMRNRFDLRAARGLARIAREFDADVVHAMFLREHYLLWLARLFGLRARRMATVHLMLEQVARPPLGWVDRAVYRGMAAIVTVCELLATQMRAAYGLGASQVIAIPNGIAVAEAPEGQWAAERTKTRVALDIPDNAVVFLTAGRFSEEKGYFFLLDAIRDWRDKAASEVAGPAPVRFVLAGDGPLLHPFRERLAQEGLTGLVTCVGYRRDLPALMRAADVYVSPSRTEAMSLSILEAMGAGLPVVATAVGGTPELIRPQWDNGLLVPCGDVAALTDALRQMARDEALRLRLGAQGAVVTREHFSESGTHRRTLAVYERLAGCMGASGRIK